MKQGDAMGKIEKDSVSLGAVSVSMPPDLIVQVRDGTPAADLSLQEAIREALRLIASQK